MLEAHSGVVSIALVGLRQRWRPDEGRSWWWCGVPVDGQLLEMPPPTFEGWG